MNSLNMSLSLLKNWIKWRNTFLWGWLSSNCRHWHSTDSGTNSGNQEIESHDWCYADCWWRIYHWLWQNPIVTWTRFLHCWEEIYIERIGLCFEGRFVWYLNLLDLKLLMFHKMLVSEFGQKKHMSLWKFGERSEKLDLTSRYSIFIPA